MNTSRAGIPDILFRARRRWQQRGPTSEAFAKLPAATVETLVKPENRDTLTKILTYHVVAGRMSAADLQKQIKAGHGMAALKTVQGETLMAMMDGGKIVLKDPNGGTAAITIANVFQSNGVVQVVDSVLSGKPRD